jgi:glycosyltransferase involved in cell wall biosynthesis
MNSSRLYYLDDIPTPYRVGVQKRIAETWPGTFHVAYCAESEPGRTWSLDYGHLSPEFLRGMQLRPPRQTNPFSFKWNLGVARSLSAFGPDVVVLSGYSHPTVWVAARWCITNRVPYAIACETSCLSSACSGWRWAAKRRIAGWIVRQMAFGLPVGRAAADYLRRFGPTDAPMFFFPNTPDTRSIASEAKIVEAPGREAALRAKLGIGVEAQVILFVGRLVDAKCPLDAVKAFREAVGHCDAALVIVGGGELMGDLRSAAEGDSRIIFTGWMEDRTMIAGLMAIATALILPSRHEPWGAVVNEAMALGTPVVASDRVGAAVELICDGENGFLVRQGDIAAFARCMRMLLQNTELRGRLGTAAKKTAVEHGEEFAANNLIAGAREAVISVRCNSRTQRNAADG